MTTPARSARPEVRNPILAMPAMAQLQALPAEQRQALAALLEGMATDAHQRAEKAWRQRKGPMAAYWRAVGVYARHTGRALRKAAASPWDGPYTEMAGKAMAWAEVEARLAGRDPLTGRHNGRQTQDPLSGQWHDA